MLSVVQSDRLDPLAGHLLDKMARDPLPPLEPEVALVAQNRGLRGWLRNALAEHAGCAASLDTAAPRAFCLRLARQLGPQEGRARGEERALRDPFIRAPLAWRVAVFLDELPPEARYDPLRAYLDEGPDRRLPLARRIAERFGDYQVYRPRLLRRWARGENPHPEHPHAAWQAPLWRRLTERIERPSRARRLLALDERLRSGNVEAAWLPERVSVFGAGLFPPPYLDVLAALSGHTDVRFYLVGGGGAGEAHRSVLSERLGRQRRVFCGLLKERGGVAAWQRLGSSPDGDDPDGDDPDGDDPDGDDAPANALEAVQQAGGEDETSAFPLAPDDRSLTVHSCHSRRRELEVLRDQLLDAFDAMPELAPSDVLVAVPRLEAYAPLIDTVFEAEQQAGGGASLPVHVASAEHGAERRVLQAAAALMALPEGRCTAPAVMELLDYPVLRRAASLGPEEVSVARRWVREAGIRWGRDAAHRAAFAGEGDREADGAKATGTWRAGLDRLLVGHATGPVAAPVCGHAPRAEANADRAELLGRLSAWLHRLFAFAENAQRGPRPLAEWSRMARDLFAGLLAPETDAEHDAADHLAETAQDLAYLAEGAPGREEAGARRAPFAAVREHVEAAIRNYEAGAEHVTGRVTFAAPMALRFAPHRVVAFLGLGDAFPPAPARPADDLIAASGPRPGDHDPEREGGQLFYDALHTAEDRLILSFVGRSEKDDAERAPSAALEALLETAETVLVAGGGPASGSRAEGSHGGGAASVRERLVTEHPLQPFHPDYFAPGSALFSYDASGGVARGGGAPAVPFAKKPLPEEASAPDDGPVRLEALQRAWAHPARFFCRRVLGLRLHGEDALDDRQPINPGALAAYRARQEALGRALGEGDDADDDARRLEADGAVPPGRQGRAWFARQRAEAREVARAVEAEGEGHARTLRAEGPGASGGDAWAVEGRLDHVAGGAALRFRCAEPNAQDLVRAWPAHLLLCAAGEAGDPQETRVIGSGGAGWRFRPLQPDPARTLLYRLVRGYREIRRAPRPFFPESALACADADGDSYKEKKARRQFYDGYHDGEESDPYVALCFRGRDPLADEVFDLFRKWAEAFFDPLLQFRAKG
jgi:exodeoxyribonuclease V gamma subunit